MLYNPGKFSSTDENMEDYEDMDDPDFEEEVEVGEEDGEEYEEGEGMEAIEENDEEEDGDFDYEEEDQSAPVYTIPPREIVAVEHPLIVKNLENGIKTFGRQPQWNKVRGNYFMPWIASAFCCLHNEEIPSHDSREIIIS